MLNTLCKCVSVCAFLTSYNCYIVIGALLFETYIHTVLHMHTSTVIRSTLNIFLSFIFILLIYYFDFIFNFSVVVHLPFVRYQNKIVSLVVPCARTFFFFRLFLFKFKQLEKKKNHNTVIFWYLNYETKLTSFKKKKMII